VAETDRRGLPIDIGTTVLYLNSVVNNVKVTEGVVIEILEDQYLIKRGRQWLGAKGWSYCTDRPVAILKHKCWVVPS
jgi:hypothetical protein